eukprot:scaffold442_cov397-Prasinococcus_capsulatus_cf.AAC.51
MLWPLGRGTKQPGRQLHACFSHGESALANPCEMQRYAPRKWPGAALSTARRVRQALPAVLEAARGPPSRGDTHGAPTLRPPEQQQANGRRSRPAPSCRRQGGRADASQGRACVRRASGRPRTRRTRSRASWVLRAAGSRDPRGWSGRVSAWCRPDVGRRVFRNQKSGSL